MERTINGKRPIVGRNEAGKHAEDARNVSIIDEDTLNQASAIRTRTFDKVTTTIRTRTFDKVTTLLQRIEHLLSQNSTPRTPKKGFLITNKMCLTQKMVRFTHWSQKLQKVRSFEPVRLFGFC